MTVYLLCAFGLSWAAQIALSLAVRDDPQGLAMLGGGILIAAVFLMWPPAVGAYVARRWVERGSFADAGLRVGPKRYIVIAWLLPTVLTGLAMVLSVPLYPFDPSFETLRQAFEQAGQTPPASLALIAAAQLAFALTLAVPINAIFAFGEEFGWRGYLQPRLMALLGYWPGLIAHGAIWGFWHAPLIFLIGYNYPGHPWLGVPLFVIAGVLLGMVFGWLRLASDSVVPPTVAHASLNATAGLPLLLLRGVDPAVGGVIYSPVGWVVLAGTIVVLMWRGALKPARTVR